MYIAASYFRRQDQKILTGWRHDISYRTSVHPCPAAGTSRLEDAAKGATVSTTCAMRLPEERMQEGKEHINLDNLCTSTRMPCHCQATSNFIPRYLAMRSIHTMHGGVLLAGPQMNVLPLPLPYTH